MISYNEFNSDMLPNRIKLVQKMENKKKVIYLNIECAFDIETTSTYTSEGEKFAFMYIWQFGISDSNSLIMYGRTWNEFLELLKIIKDKYHLSVNKRLVIYVHNLGYEFQFIQRYFEYENVFATDIRNPIKILTTMGFEFRDSYILSGMNLENTAKNLINHNVRKLVGDLDYDLVRHSKTYMTEKELAYCNNDIEVLLAYVNEQLNQYGTIIDIPLTNTGRVRQYMRTKCLGKRRRNEKYKKIMEELTLNYNEYALCKNCFQGGFTHGSMNYIGKELENVASIDFTSSYPAVMLTEKFPMSKPQKIKIKNKDELMNYVNDSDTGLIMQVEFNNISSKMLYESYISSNKCENLKDEVINNGRLFQASHLTTYITDVDFKIISQTYKFDAMKIIIAYKFKMDYLPKEIIEGVLELYEKKTTLKGIKELEAEYLINKGMLNSVYGMSVTNIIKDDYCYDKRSITDDNHSEVDELEYDSDLNVWQVKVLSIEEQKKRLNDYNENKRRFLYYPWGIFITAYARYNLWTGILNIKRDYIYSDTDSIKMLNYETHKKYIDNYNKSIENKLKNMCEFYNIDFNRCKPKTNKGVEKLIGVWDFEGTYLKFKTLGAKRYIYTEINNKTGKEELHITIAGLNKKHGANYLMKTYKTFEKVFKNFDNDLYVPADETGKSSSFYIDYEISESITDYTGITENVTSKTGLHLEPAEFTLSIPIMFINFLAQYCEGYSFEGFSNVE